MDIIMELLIIVGIGAALVSLFTQIAKGLGLVEKNLFVFVLSEVIAFIGYFAYMDIKNLPHEWYYIVGVFIAGACISFASMFGYDKFKQFLLQWKETIKVKEEDK